MSDLEKPSFDYEDENDLFNKKFELKKLESHGTVVEYVDLIPDNSESNPVFLAPGWAETPETFKETIKTIYNS
ncbi:hypothetical protein H0W91_02835 [Patescibacteria group bacterium]|nr:hypothetical protein [Patescibacteria group bacterium]